MKKQIQILLLMTIVLFSTTGQGAVPVKNQKTYVLVHGAWQAPYAWTGVKALLEKKGQKVIVVELPGHGQDKTPPQNLSIDLYRDKVIQAINAQKGKVILVGHSMAGIVISAVAEAIPDKVEKLIYIAAYLPANGQSLLALAGTDADAKVGPNLVPSADKLTLGIKQESITELFAQDATDDIKRLLLSNYKPEPAIPFTNTVTLTPEKFGKAEKVYIETLKDQVISIGLQKRMGSAAGLTRVYTIDSGHSPFLTMPVKVAEILLEAGE